MPIVHKEPSGLPELRERQPTWAHITRSATVSTQTYLRIKQMIISCELAPGTGVNEIDISRRLGISRSPLREAFRRLEEEAFMETSGGRALRVANITPRGVSELYDVRCALEAFAAGRAEDIDPRLIQMVEAKLKLIAKDLARGKVQSFNDADFEFHDLYVRRYGNATLAAQLVGLRDHLVRIWHFAGSHLDHTKLSYEEHLDILAAIRSGKASRLQAEVTRHILAVGKRVTGFVEEVSDKSTEARRGSLLKS
ncbi:GntR family transcriptional regulator [Acidisoma sp. S159]|uniref:GntR family transcriptional regulator n=1 Tax=Acidisoma sp. S159 TaxID=1747225 RepID=UPI00131A99B5|nr:GntR family transcriptional regulator [Acidisoma sp. S159]